MNRAKTGGRTKGVLNKETAVIRESFQSLINNNLKQLGEDLKELEPKDRIKAIIDLSKFVLPTLKATDLISKDDENFKRVTINLGRGIDPNATNKDANNGADRN